MPFDFAQAKAQVRQTVHDTLSVPATYEDETLSAPIPITVRWHNKQSITGEMSGDGYAEVIEGIDRLIFLSVDARAANIKRGGKVVIPLLSVSFKLHELVPNSGPIQEIWEVA